jgi:hypothetical protein
MEGFMTIEEYIGLCHGDVAIGDHVLCVVGLNNLLIVRRSNSRPPQYEVIGSRYLEGQMEREALFGRGSNGLVREWVRCNELREEDKFKVENLNRAIYKDIYYPATQEDLRLRSLPAGWNFTYRYYDNLTRTGEPGNEASPDSRILRLESASLSQWETTTTLDSQLQD